MSRIVIFVNGEAGNLNRIAAKIRPSDMVICADGGLRHALSAGVAPEAVIGDLDSVSDDEAPLLEKLSGTNARIISHPKDKDETDLELALDHAAASGAKEVLILCAFGGRIDHFLGNILLSTLHKYANLDISFSDGVQTAYSMRGPRTLTLEREEGSTLSLIPLTGVVHGVSTEGLKWKLENSELEYGSPRSLSNCFVAPRATISVREGYLFVVTLDPSGQ